MIGTSIFLLVGFLLIVFSSLRGWYHGFIPSTWCFCLPSPPLITDSVPVYLCGVITIIISFIGFFCVYLSNKNRNIGSFLLVILGFISIFLCIIPIDIIYYNTNDVYIPLCGTFLFLPNLLLISSGILGFFIAREQKYCLKESLIELDK